MGAIVTVQDVREAMNGVSFSPFQEQHIERTIDGLEEQVRTHLRVPLAPGEFTERAWVDGQGYATLKNSPINSVSSVALDPELTSGTQELDGEFKVTGNSIYVGWPYQHQHVVVTYNGGRTLTNQADIRTLIIEVAVRAAAPHHDDGRTVNGLQISQNEEQANPQRRPLRLTQEELESLDNFRRPWGL